MDDSAAYFVITVHSAGKEILSTEHAKNVPHLDLIKGKASRKVKRSFTFLETGDLRYPVEFPCIMHRVMHTSWQSGRASLGINNREYTLGDELRVVDAGDWGTEHFYRVVCWRFLFR
ncbi:hypothetical protein NC651_022493 [Populus alba x Populus x berolinensis]|nr:hypothetical protein NC651_022493 [Populus alba x Populus x berolinensis]